MKKIPKQGNKVKFADLDSDNDEQQQQSEIGMEKGAQFGDDYDDDDDEQFDEEDDDEEDGEQEDEMGRIKLSTGEEYENNEKEEVEDEDMEDEDEEGMDDEEEEEMSSADEDGSIRYEEDIEDQKMVEARRKNLPKSNVNDRFFNLAEMEAFLDSQDREENEKQQRKSNRNLGEFDAAEEMDGLIRAYEEENLRTRDWTLQGEVVADERKKDELLMQKVDVDFRTVAPPTITAEKTAQLEAIIKKRIKEKLFDDVVRKFRENEALVPVYRNQKDIEQTVRKSLAEVYEEKFNAELSNEGNSQQATKPELDPKVEAIKKDMDSLFLKLDALSHFQFRPQPIRRDEIKIVNNMPSLQIEEVGPLATAEPDANLLAPEELMKHRKRVPKAADERTETDRKRERRQKKKKQRVLASIGAMKGGQTEKEGEGNEEKRKRKRIGGKKLDFAGEMQALVESGGGSQQKMKRRKKATI